MAWTIPPDSWRWLFVFMYTVPTTWLQRVILLDCCLLLLPCMCRYCDNWRIVRDWAATSTRSLRFPWPDTENTGRRLTLCSETQWVKCCSIWQVSLIPRLCGGEKPRMRLTRLCCCFLTSAANQVEVNIYLLTELWHFLIDASILVIN